MMNTSQFLALLFSTTAVIVGIVVWMITVVGWYAIIPSVVLILAYQLSMVKVMDKVKF